MQEVLYLCDGNVETCSKTGCYKRGWECRHTTDAAHVINRRAVAGLFLTKQETFGRPMMNRGCSASAAPYFIFSISCFSHSNSR